MKNETEIKRARFILMDNLKNDYDKLQEKIGSQGIKEEKMNVSQYENMIKEINEKSNCNKNLENIFEILSEASMKLELGFNSFSKISRNIEKRNDSNNNKSSSNGHHRDLNGFEKPKNSKEKSQSRGLTFDNNTNLLPNISNSNPNSETPKKIHTSSTVNNLLNSYINNNSSTYANANNKSNNLNTNTNNNNPNDNDNTFMSFSPDSNTNKLNLNDNSNITFSNSTIMDSSNVINTPNPEDMEMKITNLAKENIIHKTNTNKEIKINPLKCFYLAMKSRPNNEIVYFDLYSKTIKSLKITESNYSPNSSICKTTNFPYDNSKYVNIGNGLLVTGGNVNRTASDHVFRLYLTKEEYGEKLQITRYSNLITKRERHNIIFIERLNLVVCCGGFYTNKCEYTNLNDQRWNRLPDMSGNRGNATLFSVNSKFIYCLGGFRVNDSAGVYLGNLEFMDIEEYIFKGNTQWKTVDLMRYGEDMKISAMGVIHQNQNTLILVGGYDGAKYLKDSWEMNFDENFNFLGLFKNDSNKANLFKGSVFFSNPEFMKVTDDILLNFELQTKTNWYSKNNYGFIENNPFLQEYE